MSLNKNNVWSRSKITKHQRAKSKKASWEALPASIFCKRDRTLRKDGAPIRWSFFDPMPEVISMGFQMLTWLWSIKIVIRPNDWHALSRNKDRRMMYWPWTQWNGIRKRNLIRFSGNRSFKNVFASMSIPENMVSSGGRRSEDGVACFCKRFLFSNLLPCLTFRWKGAQEYHHRSGRIAS